MISVGGQLKKACENLPSHAGGSRGPILNCLTQ